MTKASKEAVISTNVDCHFFHWAGCTGRTFVQSRKPDAKCSAGNATIIMIFRWISIFRNKEINLNLFSPLTRTFPYPVTPHLLRGLV